MKVKNLAINFIFSLCFVAAMTMGYFLDKNGSVNLLSPLGICFVIVASLCLTPLVTFLIKKLDDLLAKRSTETKSEILPFSLKYFLIRFAGMVVCYSVVWLAVWPGFFCYDAETEAYMVITYKFSQHHPLLHELLLGNTLRLGNRIFGNFNAGIAIYIGAQMLIVALCFAYMLTTFRRLNVPKIACNIAWAFMGLFPTVVMFALCSSKDVLFTVGVVLLGTVILQFIKGIYEKHLYILFAAGSLLLLFFRKNGMYVYPFLLAVLLLLIVLGKETSDSRKSLIKLIIIGACCIVVYLSVTAILAKSLNAAKDESAEKLCVPMQQLARVYNERPEVWSEEEKEILYEIFPEVILKRYNPKLADDIKFNFLEDNYKSDKAKYIKFWWDTFKRCPDIYVNSFLMNTYGYWYPNTVLSGYEGYKIVDRYYGESCYFQFVTENPGVRKSFIPPIERFYEMLSLEVSFQKIPVISWLFSIGFHMWGYAFLAMFLIQTKAKDGRKMLICLLIPFLLLMINLLGPIALVRYVLFYFFGASFIICIWPVIYSNYTPNN